jgi:hypothetical protein
MGTFAETGSAITVCRLPTKENKLLFPLATNKEKFAVPVFRLQQTKGSRHFPLVPFSVCRCCCPLNIYSGGHHNVEGSAAIESANF